MKNEIIRMLCFDIELTQALCGKILQIKGHNHVSSCTDCSRKNVPVVVVRESQSGNQAFVAGHQTIDMLVHVLSGSLQLFTSQIRGVPSGRFESIRRGSRPTI